MVDVWGTTVKCYGSGMVEGFEGSVEWGFVVGQKSRG